MDLSNENEKYISRKPINSDTNDSWLRILKRSFGIGKYRSRSKPATAGTNTSNQFDGKKSPFNIENVDNLYFTDEFLDSFTSKTNKSRFGNNLFRFKFRGSNSHAVLDANNGSILNNISDESDKMESILLRVVDDYIFSTCEKMLQDKMRYVYQKMHNWYKNPLTRPGFKKTNPSLGGNITKPEKYSLPRQTITLPKKENSVISPESERKELLSKNIKKLTENIEKSSNLNNIVCEKVNVLKSTRFLSSNRYFNKDKRVNSSENVNVSSIKESIKTENNTKVYSNLGFLFNRSDKTNSISESCSKVLSIKCSQNNFGKTIKNNDSSALSAADDSSSKLFAPAVANLKMKRESFFKCSKSRKPSVKSFSIVDELKKTEDKYKLLNIIKLSTIDIKPLENHFNKNAEINSEEENHRKLLATFDDIDEIIRNENKDHKEVNILKSRRSVTFQEPRNYNLSLPLCRESVFCSSVDIRSPCTLPNVISARSEELNDYFSTTSLASFQYLKNTNTDFSKADTSSHRFGGFENISSFLKDDNVSRDQRNERDSVFLNSNKSNSGASPVVVSLHSTASLSDDNLEKKYEIINDISVENVNYSIAYDTDKTSINTTLKYASTDKILRAKEENLSNYIPFSETIKTSPISGHNYSIIEIVNKIKSRGDEETCNGTLYPTLTLQNETVNSSPGSILDNDDLLIATDNVKSNAVSYTSSMQQEIMLSEEDTNCNECISKSLHKPSVALSQMKTANFSSSSIMEESRSIADLTLAVTPSHLYLSQKTKRRTNSKPLTAHQSLPIQTQQNNDKHPNLMKKLPNQTEHRNNLLKHTLSSKQKCRLKMPSKTDIYRHPMKF